MNRTAQLRTRPATAGFTLIELLIVTLVFGIVVAGALGFMTTQYTSFTKGLDQLKTLQNLRFGYQTLDIDLAALGSNVPDGQPSLVLVDEDVLAFTGDYTSNLEGDVSAVFVDPDAPDGMVQAPRSGVDLPNSSVSWPDTVYESFGGAPSLAELIVHFFEPDTSTSRSDDYVLKRQVNDGEPEVISRNLLRQGDMPFFRYFLQQDFADDESSLDSIPDDALPLWHAIEIHGSADDVGMSATVDKVRAIRVTFRATNGREGDAERFADLSRVIHLPNAAFELLGTCGDEPIVNDQLDAKVFTNPNLRVRLKWNRSADEDGGERDVVRYVIYRREAGAGEWGDPYISIPAGLNNYMYTDTNLEPGTTYEYGHAAQDCTPSLSAISQAQSVTVPAS